MRSFLFDPFQKQKFSSFQLKNEWWNLNNLAFTFILFGFKNILYNENFID